MTPAAGGNPAPSPRAPNEAAPPRQIMLSGRQLHRVQDRDTQTKLRRSRRVRRGPLTLSCVPDSRLGPARVAFAIGRNVGGAVHRNRVRRRLREVMSELAPRLAGRAWLVGASAEALTTDFELLRGHADAAVRQLEPK